MSKRLVATHERELKYMYMYRVRLPVFDSHCLIDDLDCTDFPGYCLINSLIATIINLSRTAMYKTAKAIRTTEYYISLINNCVVILCFVALFNARPKGSAIQD